MSLVVAMPLRQAADEILLDVNRRRARRRQAGAECFGLCCAYFALTGAGGVNMIGRNLAKICENKTVTIPSKRGRLNDTAE
jgi:hypothetical protein